MSSDTYADRSIPAVARRNRKSRSPSRLPLGDNPGPAADREQAIAVIRAAVGRGVIFLDTAEVCGPLTNGALVGEALTPFPEQVVMATKYGFDLANFPALYSRPEHIKQVVDGSLKRLRTERAGPAARPGARIFPIRGTRGLERMHDKTGAVYRISYGTDPES